MNKLLFSLLFTFFFCLSIHAEVEKELFWQDKWSEALLLLDDSSWEEGKNVLDEAILLAENSQDSFPYKNYFILYVDRARANVLMGNFKEALSDVEIALHSELLDKQQKIRALTTKIFVEAHLGIKENVMSDLGSLIPFLDLPFIELPFLDLPLIEWRNNVLIINNIPKSKVYQKLISCYLIHVGLCYDKDDISFLKQNRIVAEKINHCGCKKCIAEYAKTRKCDSCHAVVSPTKENISVEKLIQALIQYGSKMNLQFEDQQALLMAILNIEQIGLSIELFPDTLDHIFKEVSQEKALYFD